MIEENIINQTNNFNQDLSLTIDLAPCVNFALQQAHFDIIRSITIYNKSNNDLSNLILKIYSNPTLVEEKQIHIDLLPSLTPIKLNEIKTNLNAEYLIEINETIKGTIFFELLDQNQNIIQKQSSEISILAYDQWIGTSLYPELIACYVMPKHPSLAKIISDAANILEKWNIDPIFDGYLSEDPNRVLKMGAALYEALRQQNILYVVSSKVYATLGQRIKLCDQVLEQKQGNCIELSLLYASLLEAIGINPLLILTQDHAFVGFWLEDKNFPSVLQDDISLITKRIADGINEIVVLESTALVHGNNNDFKDAQELALQHLKNPEQIEYIVDLKEARVCNITPLPIRIKGEHGWTVEREKIEDLNATSPDEINKTVITTPTTTELTKKQVWERKLLDLGLRNTLISMRLNKVLVPLLCNTLSELEDLLADGENFTILPRPEEISFKQEDLNFDTLHNLPQFKDLIDQDFANRRIRSILTDAALKDKLKDLFRAAKVSLEENGTNTLYLALGILKWYESERSTKARYAPLVLLPIEITRRSAISGFNLRLRDEEPMMNFTILEKLKQDFKINIEGLDPLPTDDHGVDLKLILNIIRKAIVDQPRWDVFESAYLGIFSFTQFVMWNDIRNRSDDLSKNKIVKSLIEGKLCWQSNFTTIPSEVDEDDAILPIAADASQLYAINAAANGESFVLHGPPGTGKSQTITGLIGNALGKGKSVLFVAEKMAALSVVEKRLSKIGLGAFCLEIHSNKAKKNVILEQLQQTLELAREKGESYYSEKANQLGQIREELAQYVRALKEPQTCGFNTYELINLYEQYKDHKTSLTLPTTFISNLTKDQILAHEKLLQELVAIGRDLGDLHEHALSLITNTEYSEQMPQEISKLLSSYEQALSQIEQDFKEINDDLVQPLRSYKDLEQFSQIIENILTLTSLPELWYTAPNRQHILVELRDLTDVYQDSQKIKEELSKDWNEEFFKLNGTELNQQYQGIMKKWFLAKFFAQRSFVSTIMSYYKGSDFSSVDLAHDLAKLDKYTSDLTSSQTRIKECADYLGDLYDGNRTDLNKITEAVQTAQRLLMEFKDLNFDLSKLQNKTLIASCKEANLHWENYKEQLNKVDQLLKLDQENTTIPWLAQNHKMISELREHPEILREWIIFNRHKKDACDQGLSELIKLYSTELSHDQILDHYHNAIYQSLLALVIDRNEILKNFSGAKFNEQIRMFKGLSSQVQKLAQQEIYFRLLAKLPDPTIDGAKSSELGILQRAIRNKGRGITIRKLFEQIPNLLPRLCPCMLMSPISVAQYLDPNREPFDLVVFDEASQLPTRKAVGAIARGNNAVIVGDPKQMPPTSFFMSANEDEDNLEMEDLESILDDALALNLPQSHLLWHYRSRHESLISFSNQQFYGNDLYTFPSTNDRESKVTLQKVDGYFERGGKRVNRAEAEAIVQEIIKRSQDPIQSKQSLGVVTFNISQQNLIDDLLFEACRKDQKLDLWVNVQEEPLFIKNLENVQGDERDVILFSIAYGKDRDGKMAMNFGPLNRDGGWRRLNVAVTRARQEMKVFSSISFEDIDLNRTGAEGVRALRNFLEFAERGSFNMDANAAAQHAQKRDQITQSIAKVITEQGYQVDLAIGKSKFNVDVAVIDPNDPQKYIMGILLDGKSYQEAHSVYDREITQVSVLEGLGWYILRIWALDWKNNRQKEISKILEILNNLKDPKKKEQLVEEAKVKPLEVPEPKIINSSASNDPDQPKGGVYRLKTASSPKDNEINLKLELQSPKQLTSDELISGAYKRELIAKGKRLIEIAAPLSQSLFNKLLIDAYGISRSNKKLDSYLAGIAFEVGARRYSDQVNGEYYYWASHQDPKNYHSYRKSFYGITRSGTDLVSDEVSAAMLDVVKNMVGIHEDELIKETGKLVGINRTSKNMNEYFKAIFDKLVHEHKITISNGSCLIPND